MYSKGSAMIHAIRQLINNDEKFKQLLRGLNKHYWHATVTTEQIEKYMIENSGLKLAKIFDQYLRTNKIPTLEYKQTPTGINYRWTNCVQDFDMKIKLQNGKVLDTTENWNELKNTTIKDFQIDLNLYINVVKVD
jgi:aminopeptidase N